MKTPTALKCSSCISSDMIARHHPFVPFHRERQRERKAERERERVWARKRERERERGREREREREDNQIWHLLRKLLILNNCQLHYTSLIQLSMIVKQNWGVVSILFGKQQAWPLQAAMDRYESTAKALQTSSRKELSVDFANAQVSHLGL